MRKKLETKRRRCLIIITLGFNPGKALYSNPALQMVLAKNRKSLNCKWFSPVLFSAFVAQNFGFLKRDEPAFFAEIHNFIQSWYKSI